MSNRFIVLKFGGTSVANPEAWKTIAKLAAEHMAMGLKPFIVCSALSGVSNLLSGLLEKALLGTQAEILHELHHRHLQFAADLQLNAEELLSETLAELDRLVLGVSLTRETSPVLQAKVMAFGELLLTRIAANYLNQHIPARLLDARDYLHSISMPGVSAEREYLSALCDFHPDENFQKTLMEFPEKVLLTQGFIASNAQGQTVLLGRGGSDTSAAYFAAKLMAVSCEIWTDVPGVYSADPRIIRHAQLIKSLHVDEAREIAANGGKVLHPLCLDPVAQYRIPLVVRCTTAPEKEGTLVHHDITLTDSRVKAISSKLGVIVISMQSASMWLQVGFLARIFQCFEAHGISVDIIATSENNVTVTLDSNRYLYSLEKIELLKKELSQYCQVDVIMSCAAISLIGRNIRAILHQLTPVFEVFKEQKIYLLSQATNDLNLTVVVDEAESDKLLIKIHDLLFERDLVVENTAILQALWWVRQRDNLLAMSHTPVYIYDENALLQQIESLKKISAVGQFFYAMKANYHEKVLQTFYDAGLSFECVSPGEVTRIFALFPEIDPKRILFTPSFVPKQEYEEALGKKIYVNVDNISPIIDWPEVFAGKEILLRLDPGLSRGHHRYVQTGGNQAKFGIEEAQLDILIENLERHDIRVIGLHAHFGSGVMEEESWGEVAIFLMRIAERFPHVRILNVGGGLGVPTYFDQAELNLERINENLSLIRQANPHMELWMEPGRYLVAQAGILLVKVTQIKQKSGVHYIGVDTGMNSLIRPSLYSAYHEIVNLTRLYEPCTEIAHIVGPICETGDVLGYSRSLPKTEVGDVLLIATAGAYGRVMSSHYNLREPAEEVWIPAS